MSFLPRDFPAADLGPRCHNWDNEHQTAVSGLLVRLGGPAQRQRVRRRHVWSRTTTTQRSRAFGQLPTDPPNVTFTSTQATTDLTLVAGAELSARLSTHVSLVPQFRLLFVPRDTDNFFDAQLATYLYHVGIGVRVWFR